MRVYPGLVSDNQSSLISSEISLIEEEIPRQPGWSISASRLRQSLVLIRPGSSDHDSSVLRYLGQTKACRLEKYIGIDEPTGVVAWSLVLTPHSEDTSQDANRPSNTGHFYILWLKAGGAGLGNNKEGDGTH